MKVPKNELHFPGSPNSSPATGPTRVSGDDLVKLAGTVSSMSTVAAQATGHCDVQFVFKDHLGNPITYPATMTCFVSTSAGRQFTAGVTTLAVLTNGDLVSLIAGKVALVTTDATGKLGVTITTATPSLYYLTFVNEANGQSLTSTFLTVN